MMASLVAIFSMFSVILQVGVHCQIVSMHAATSGYTKGGKETTDNAGIKVRMDRYTGGNDCVKVMLIEQKQPLRKLDEITVSCVWENWSVTNTMVSYGDILHIQTKGKKAEWAVFDLGSKCVQHVYKEEGGYQLGKEETIVSRKECDQAIRTQKPYKSQTPIWEDHEEDEALLSGIEEDDDSADIIEMNSNVVGYRFTGTMSKNDNGVSQELVQDYVSSYGECVRLVILSIQGMEAQGLKVHCSVTGRKVNGHYQYGSAFTFRPESVDVFNGLFNLGYGTCVRKTYTITKGFFQKVVVSPDVATSDEECQDLAKGRDLLGTSGSTLSSQSGLAHSDDDDGSTGFVNNFNNDQNVHTTPGNEHALVEEEDEGEWGEEEGNKDEEDDGGLEGEEDGHEEGDGEWEEDAGEHEEGQWGVEEEDDQHHVEAIEPLKTPGNKPTETPQSKEDYLLISKQKVALLSSDVAGYKKEGDAKTIQGRSFLFTVQKYVKPGTEECFKMVTVWKDNEVRDHAKISCEYEEPDKLRGLNLHFEGVIYESLPFSVIYVVKDGLCMSKNYYEHSPIKQQVLTEPECQRLTGRTKKERVSGVIPGSEPISEEDFAVMETQIVAVLKGSVNGFTAENHQSTYTTASFIVEVQDYVKGSQCVKVVSLKRDDHDQYFERIKVPCKVRAPVITDDEDIELNFGNVIYVQNRVSVVYVIEDGVCLERTYYVAMEQAKYNERTLSLPECYTLTRWKREQRSSSEKLNQQPPPKSLEAPGVMWMLSVNGNMEDGFTAVAGSSYINGGTFSLRFQEFGKEERCVRMVTLKIQDVEADKFQVSCGPLKNINMIGDYVKYGKAFLIVPLPTTNTYIARFNLRDRSCVKKTYTVKKGDPVKILKSQNARVSDKECKGLMEGTVQVNTMATANGGAGIAPNYPESVGNTVVMGDGMTIGNVGPNDHVVM